MQSAGRFSTNNRGNVNLARTFSTQTATKSDNNAAAEVISEEVLDSATSKEDQFIKKLRERYPGVKASRIPMALRSMDVDRDIAAAEEKIMSDYGFLKEEVNFIMRYNPKFLL